MRQRNSKWDNKESPFTPGSPVPSEFFVGRKEQIEKLLRYVKQTLGGKPENIFLLGDRGIGKSSFASFMRYYVSTHKKMLGIHTFLNKVSTLEEMTRLIFEEIAKETQQQGWFKNIAESFGDYIKEVGLFGVTISFNPPQQKLKELVSKFPETLANLLKEIKKQKDGLFIALDDINGLASKKEFAHWYKSFVDEVATHYKNFPVFVMLIGLPEQRDILYNHQPSLMRIFRIIEIEKLFNEEVKEFFSKAFKQVAIKVKPDAMNVMTIYSSGLPLLMHEIGDATFWADNDGIIDVKDAVEGILEAAENVGRKYLDPKVYRTIRSERYRSILRKLGKEMPLYRGFRKKEVEAKLTEPEKKVFNNFLRRMQELGVIERDVEGGRGAYKFVNEIYPLYIRMESIKHTQKKPT